MTEWGVVTVIVALVGLIATGDVAAKDGRVYVSGQNGNVWEPGTINVKWTDVGPVGGPFEGYDEDGNPVEAEAKSVE